MNITIIIRRGQEEVLSRVLSNGAYVIGSSEFCNIVVTDPSVNARHLELRITEGAVYVTHVTEGASGSAGRPAIAEVFDGEEIPFGTLRMTVHWGVKVAGTLSLEGMATLETPTHETGPSEILRDDKAPAQPSSEFLPELAPSDTPRLETEVLEPHPLEAPYPAQKSEGTAIDPSGTQVEFQPLAARLVFMEGPKAGQELLLQTFEITLGRSKKADIFLDDDKLSRLHSKLTRVGTGYRLIDLSSRNGTYVNGIRILEHPLKTLDEIQIGASKIKFYLQDMGASDRSESVVLLDPVASTISTSHSIERTDSLELDVVPEKPRLPPETTSTVEIAPQYTATFGQASDPIFTTPKHNWKAIGICSAIVVLGLISVFVPSILKNLAINDESAVKKPHLSLRDPNTAERPGKKTKTVSPSRVLVPPVLTNREQPSADKPADLNYYLKRGMIHLKAENFEAAAQAFSSALSLDPNNEAAIEGLRESENGIAGASKSPSKLSELRAAGSDVEKRKQVTELLKKASESFSSKAYQEAINTADRVRAIEIKGDTEYLNEAKQIIDRARMAQKDEFEPFLNQAKELYAAGDYMTSREMCEEMQKRDPSYNEAKDCLSQAKRQLNHLAEEAYKNGQVLESMNRNEDAKKFYNRAKGYVRKGDLHYEKIMKKLEYYQ